MQRNAHRHDRVVVVDEGMALMGELLRGIVDTFKGLLGLEWGIYEYYFGGCTKPIRDAGLCETCDALYRGL